MIPHSYNNPPVLLADGDLALRERLSNALHARGYHTVGVENTAQMREAAGAQRFLAAVVELRLPSEGGLSAICELRLMQPDMRIVVLTGYGSIPTAIEALRLGAIDYLTKPADVDQLLSAITGQPSAAPSIDPSVRSLCWVEWQHLNRVLTECRGNVTRAARLLGIDRRSLQRKLSKYAPAA